MNIKGIYISTQIEIDDEFTSMLIKDDSCDNFNVVMYIRGVIKK